MNANNKQFIKNPGGCIVSNNILQKKGHLKWCVREMPYNSVDNGWRFFSDIDTEDYLDNPNNLSVCDFNTVAEIEPAVIAIYDCVIGTEAVLIIADGVKRFVDGISGKEIVLDYCD